jgi:putative membrane protein
MEQVLATLYYWMKAGHIIFVIFWMAGLFMAPRQLVYMHAAAPGSDEEALWLKRSKTLRAMILTPSLIVVWVLGLLLAYTIGAFSQGWFHAKLAIVLLLTVYHMWIVRTGRKMGAGERPLSEKQLRLWGEVPAIAVALIVVLVIVKPF